MKPIIVFFFVIQNLIFASEEVRKSFTGLGVLISDKYREGSYLIYDCLQGHFACVDSESFDLCQNKRKKAFEDKTLKLPCAPLKKFTSFKDCTAAHYKRMSSITDKSFCLRSKKELIKY